MVGEEIEEGGDGNGCVGTTYTMSIISSYLSYIGISNWLFKMPTPKGWEGRTWDLSLRSWIGEVIGTVENYSGLKRKHKCYKYQLNE